VGAYTISISPEDGSGTQTTVWVDVDDEGAGTRITELTVKAASGEGLLPQHLPAIDLELLLQAIGPAASYDPSIRVPQRSAASGPRPGVGAATRSAERAPQGARRHRDSRVGVKAGSSALGGRAYRRMPDDLAEVYERSQSVTAVAQHYGVPRHTAQGWMNRLRERVRSQ
jgi:hypothetical protein